ncbi:hypothetical protein Mycch_5239 [Mycolicibacterium chubuense NBB4]|uniref:Transmembrane protein n=1 Tax=Mycolicibacterium chubuense (strain NBB4) TaxID=710421 RepID=I4BRL7_MYCCN|nr:hypothetical protein [Mycolicibacterium chubuense]AFM19924.1 hypothetical protein Mycch_5239 [Mycolicibacterium chubuense NBB4]
MARDTRGPMPPETSDLRRVSLNPPHWRQARRLLAVEAVVTGVIGVVGLIGVAVAPHNDGWRVLGVPLTPALSAVLIGIGVAAALAMTHRRAAKVFTLAMSAATVALMIICSVAAVHHDPGPLGFTAPAILLWTILFCWSIASAMWVFPDQIQGPDWVPRRRPRRPADTAASARRAKS